MSRCPTSTPSPTTSIIATAGHDTTSATISGGLQALIENPDQLRRLTADLDLMPLATEEMIRWVTPVKEFMRTAAEDTTVRGVPIAAGESVLLSYVSGNRDEDVFDDPFRFDVGRDPNKHVAFGYGVHFCLGAALARMEVNSFFSELLPRLESVELAGRPAAHRDDVRRRAQAPADPLLAAAEALTTAPGLSEAAVSPDGLSDRQRNPDPEEIETPLVVAGIPHRLLVETEVVDRRWRRPPRRRQRPVPYRRRRCAPAPRRQSVTPGGAVESSAPVVVLGTPRWPPIVTVRAAEIAGR